jgi:DNA-binding MarR family transcriptional regulator
MPPPATRPATKPAADPGADPRHCALRLRASVSQLTRQLRAALPADAISVAKLSVLALLHRLGPLTPSELARRERVRLQSLTRLLAELEAEGWLRRETHPADGRQSLLSLTKPGVKMLTADVHRREASLVDAIGATLSATERAQLLRACALIDRVADAVAGEPLDAAPKSGRVT